MYSPALQSNVTSSSGLYLADAASCVAKGATVAAIHATASFLCSTICGHPLMLEKNREVLVANYTPHSKGALEP